jgi:ketosteroid isomerase-like protein
MSRENAETVRRSWEGWMKGDATALAVFDSDVVFEDDFLPDHVGETYRGVEGLQRAWFVWAEPWAEFETDIEWVRGAGTDAVVSCHRARMRGKGSGVKGERRYAYVWRFRAGKIIHCKAFGEPSEALEAVGLSEQDAHADS